MGFGDVGTTVAGRYVVEARLGAGGMGVVVRARDNKLGRDVAIKILAPASLGDHLARERLVREARAAAALEHPGIVHVYDVGEDEGGALFLVMELVRGETLRARIDRSAAKDDMLRAGIEAARALAFAHARGIVHRDVKPENVMIRDDGRAVVLDFGIAKSTVVTTSGASTKLTDQGQIIGTPMYMSPEQAELGAVDGSSDQFSLAVTLYEATTRQTPWKGTSHAAIVAQILRDDAPPPRSVDPSLPAALDAALARAMAKKPGDRYAGLDAFADALEEITQRAGGRSSGVPASLALTEHLPENRATASTTAARARARWPWIVAAAAIAAGTTIGAVKYFHHEDPLVQKPIAGATDPNDTEPGLDHTTRFRIPIDGSPRRGGKEPLVTIVELADFECPYSAGFEDTLAAVSKHYGDDVALVWKDVVFDIHPHARAAARFARSAQAQLGDDLGFWPAHDRLFGSCTALEDADLARLAKDLGLDVNKTADAVRAADPPVFARDADLALDYNQAGIPSYFINGRFWSGKRRFDALRPIIDAELASAAAMVARGVPRAKIYEELMKGAAGPLPEPPRINFVPEQQATPSIIGEHAVVDVHHFGRHSADFENMIEPIIQQMLAVYGDRIRYYWHELPDFDDPKSMNAALAGRAALAIGGDKAFWRLHKILIDNEEHYFKPAWTPRGFGAEAVVDYAEQAGLQPGYFRNAMKAPGAREDLERSAKAAAAAGIHFEDSAGMFVIDGRRVGCAQFRELQRAIERALAAKR